MWAMAEPAIAPDVALRRRRQRLGYSDSEAFVEAVGDERAEGVDRLLGVGAPRVQDEGRALGGGEHHEAEDALAGDRLLAIRDRHVRGEAGGGFDEARRGARV